LIVVIFAISIIWARLQGPADTDAAEKAKGVLEETGEGSE
jgi:hypothetical protein